MTDDEFFNFCQDNPELRIQRNQNREIVIISPTGSKSGLICAEILRQLANWNVERKLGFVFDSSTGFTLPDQSVFSADATFVRLEKWEALTEEEQERFAPLSPEFIIEVKSNHDSLPMLQEKMIRWIQNEVQLAWLINPGSKKTWIYRSNGTIDLHEGMTGMLEGAEVLPGFALDLSRLSY